MKVKVTQTVFMGGELVFPPSIVEIDDKTAKALINKGLATKNLDKPTPLTADGKDYFCIASGASLTKKDCNEVEKWRKQDPKKRGVIVVNNVFELLPNADALVALDRKWWDFYKPEFKGAKYSSTTFGNVSKMPTKHNNSGLAAIALADSLNAKNIYLLGYDLQKTKNKIHWHKDHPKELGNAKNMKDWLGMFNNNVFDNVTNCSKNTALEVYPKKELKEVLNDSND